MRKKMTKLAGKEAVDEYLREFPEKVREMLQQLRRTIEEVAPEAEEAISYGIPTFKLNGNLVHFAGYKNHIGFYPTPSGVEKFKQQLAPFVHAKGSIRFPVDQPLPLDLIRQIVKFRVRENQAKPRPEKR
jgi:uncharacterized protein YdhG (YjbR/CyaY superfamily)